jgi:hypothetical protein
MHKCVYLTVHITKLQLQTTFSKPLYISHVSMYPKSQFASHYDELLWLLPKGCQSYQSTIHPYILVCFGALCEEYMLSLLSILYQNLWGAPPPLGQACLY